MSRKFTLIKDYYEEGVDLYKKKTITVKDGVTVLVGCNGIGKTTLLHQIKDKLKKENIPCITFDNLRDGGSKAISSASFYGNFNFMATAMCSSEGENIVMNLGVLASKLRHFIETGDMQDRTDTLRNAFIRSFNNVDEETEKKETPKERWILLDAVDSGLSVDNIVELKEQLFKTILKENFGNAIYIIISANEYEMARNEQCFDVYNGKYVKLNDYEEYRNFVLETREWKNQRYETEEKTE